MTQSPRGMHYMGSPPLKLLLGCLRKAHKCPIISIILCKGVNFIAFKIAIVYITDQTQPQGGQR